MSQKIQVKCLFAILLLTVSVDGSGSGNAYVTGRTNGGHDMFLIKISSIPEPASIAMLAGIALTALLYCKRKHV